LGIRKLLNGDDIALTNRVLLASCLYNGEFHNGEQYI
jgi:hypothetical protein